MGGKREKKTHGGWNLYHWCVYHSGTGSDEFPGPSSPPLSHKTGEREGHTPSSCVPTYAAPGQSCRGALLIHKA